MRLLRGGNLDLRFVEAEKNPLVRVVSIGGNFVLAYAAVSQGRASGSFVDAPALPSPGRLILKPNLRSPGGIGQPLAPFGSTHCQQALGNEAVDIRGLAKIVVLVRWKSRTVLGADLNGNRRTVLNHLVAQPRMPLEPALHTSMVSST